MSANSPVTNYMDSGISDAKWESARKSQCHVTGG